jgi:CheY-like chemotaxis protein
MPDGTGYDLMKRVRALAPEHGGLTPAIAVSAPENMNDALAAGFQHFVAKPFDLSELIDTMATFLTGRTP